MKSKLIHRTDAPGIIFRALIVSSPLLILVLSSLSYWAYKAKITWSDITKCLSGLLDVILKSLLFVIPLIAIILIAIGLIYFATHFNKILMWIRWNGETGYHFAVMKSTDDRLRNSFVQQVTDSINRKLKSSDISLSVREKYEHFINIPIENIDEKVKYGLDDISGNYFISNEDVHLNLH